MKALELWLFCLEHFLGVHPHPISAAFLAQAAQVLPISSWEGILEERNSVDVCGFPCCVSTPIAVGSQQFCSLQCQHRMEQLTRDLSLHPPLSEPTTLRILLSLLEQIDPSDMPMSDVFSASLLELRRKVEEQGCADPAPSNRPTGESSSSRKLVGDVREHVVVSPVQEEDPPAAVLEQPQEKESRRESPPLSSGTAAPRSRVRDVLLQQATQGMADLDVSPGMSITTSSGGFSYGVSRPPPPGPKSVGAGSSSQVPTKSVLVKDKGKGRGHGAGLEQPQEGSSSKGAKKESIFLRQRKAVHWGEEDEEEEGPQHGDEEESMESSSDDESDEEFVLPPLTVYQKVWRLFSQLASGQTVRYLGGDSCASGDLSANVGYTGLFQVKVVNEEGYEERVEVGAPLPPDIEVLQQGFLELRSHLHKCLPDVWQLLQKESEQQGEGGGPTLSVLEAHLDELLGTFRFNRGLADLEESGWRLVVALLVDTLCGSLPSLSEFSRWSRPPNVISEICAACGLSPVVPSSHPSKGGVTNLPFQFENLLSLVRGDHLA